MQGWQENKDYPGDSSSSAQFRRLNGSEPGKGRSRPQRPATMARVNRPPAARRVARPQREDAKPVNWRRRSLIWLAIFVVCGLFACFIGYALENLFAAINTTASPASVATDFLGSISSQNYNQAYNDLDATITVQMSLNDFIKMAQDTDKCYGQQTHYTEVPNSAVVQNSTQSYTYTITRSKLAQPYSLRLTLTLTQDNQNNWRISSFGANNDLGPGQSPCS